MDPLRQPHDDDRPGDNDHPAPAKFLDHAEAVIEQHNKRALFLDDLPRVHYRARPATELAGACAALAAVVLDFRGALAGAQLTVLSEPVGGVYARIAAADGSIIELRLPADDGR